MYVWSWRRHYMATHVALLALWEGISSLDSPNKRPLIRIFDRLLLDRMNANKHSSCRLYQGTWSPPDVIIMILSNSDVCVGPHIDAWNHFYVTYIYWNATALWILRDIMNITTTIGICISISQSHLLPAAWAWFCIHVFHWCRHASIC